MTEPTEAPVPAGFAPLPTRSPFITMVGPYFVAVDEDQVIIGLRVEERHCNSSGRLHGGMVSAIADIALGNNIGRLLQQRRTEREEQETPPTQGPGIATVSLNTDFVGTARVGDWVETRVEVQRAGRSLAFANAYLLCGEERIARSSAVFRVLGSS